MANVKLTVTGVKNFKSKKDGKDLYLISLKDDVYVEELKEYKGGFSVFTNKETYDAIKAGQDITLMFTSSNNAKMV